jgi:hypothetical protein
MKNLGQIGKMIAGGALAASMHLTIVGFFFVSELPIFGNMALIDLGPSILIARFVTPDAPDFVLPGIFWSSLIWAAIGALLISGVRRWRNIGLALIVVNWAIGLVVLLTMPNPI